MWFELFYPWLYETEVGVHHMVSKARIYSITRFQIIIHGRQIVTNKKHAKGQSCGLLPHLIPFLIFACNDG